MKNSTRGFALFLVAAVVCYIAVSCNFKKDYSTEVKRLDSLTVIVNASSIQLKNMAELSNNADSALANIQFIQHNYRSVMPQPMASTLNQYGLMRKDMQNIVEFSQTLRSQLDSTQVRIVDLQQALQEGATHDSKDNKLTEDYVKSALQVEAKKAGELLDKANQCEATASNLRKVYQELNPQVKLWVDSITPNEMK